MDNEELLEWHEFNEETIEALMEDGTDHSKPHVIEHHFACNNFDKLEKAAVDTFKAGFEVSDAEELVLDDGGIVFCYDAVTEKELNLEAFNKDTDALVKIAQKHGVHYDGWGTYFIEKPN